MIADLLSSSVLGLWLLKAGILKPPPIQAKTFPTFVLQPADSRRDQTIQAYLAQLAQQGMASTQQAIWMQSEQDLLVNHQGQKRQTPASLTKIATTYALLKTLGPNHVFQTKIFTTGPISNDVLSGDLVIQAEGDPLLITPEIITLGNQLNQLGLHRVTGNLVLQGPIATNLSAEVPAADVIRRVWNSSDWTEDIRQTHAAMRKGTPKPTIAISGDASESASEVNSGGTPLLNHASLPLVTLLRIMNVYSSNFMAEWFSDLAGGAEQIQALAIQSGRVPPTEIKLVNGSGLGQDNKLSPRAVVGLLQAIQAELQPFNLGLGDAFPTAGQDRGAVEERSMPKATIVKTGTLWNTSGLAGILPTQRYGTVWFAIMNQGDDFTNGFRSAQDKLLQQLGTQWKMSEADSLASSPKAADPIVQERWRNAARFMQADFLTH